MNIISSVSKSAFLGHIGSQLKSIRQSRNITIEFVAKPLKISAKRLQLIENGERDIRLDLFVKLCDFYGVDPGDVLP